MLPLCMYKGRLVVLTRDFPKDVSYKLVSVETRMSSCMVCLSTKYRLCDCSFLNITVSSIVRCLTNFVELCTEQPDIRWESFCTTTYSVDLSNSYFLFQPVKNILIVFFSQLPTGYPGRSNPANSVYSIW